MLRFLAIVSHSDDAPDAIRLRQWVSSNYRDGWVCVLNAPNVVVWSTGTSPSDLHALEENRGIVIGPLFRQAGERAENLSPSAQLTDIDRVRISRSGGEELVNHYWGQYVAFLRNPDSSAVSVLRSPASSLPCLHIRVGEVHIYFSRMEDCAKLDLPFSIDWQHVARSLLGPLCSEHTSIREVRELLPGSVDRIDSATHKRVILWDPVKIASAFQIRDPAAAAERLRLVIRSSIHALASHYECILHSLSGGLDSSIVLACLASAPSLSRLVCLTHFSKDAESDERQFARLAARRAGCEHVEYPRDTDVDLRTIQSPVRWEVSPGLRIPAVDRIDPDVAHAVGARAIFRGHGGDELFCRHHLSLSVSDFVRRFGRLSDLPGLLTHVAVLEGETTWRILWKALEKAFLPRRWNIAAQFVQDIEGESLLHPDMVQELARSRTFDMPYAESTWAAPAGRLFQVNLVMARRRYYASFMREDDPPGITPLLCQPIVEACLQIPTDFQMRGRRDRAVARAAFAQDLPLPIEQRREKGGAERMAADVLRRNQSFVRELLLDGIVLRQGIVDRPRVEQALSDVPFAGPLGTAPLFDLVGAEVWARAWHDG